MENKLADFKDKNAVRHLEGTKRPGKFMKLRWTTIVLLAVVLVFYLGSIGENTFARNTPSVVDEPIPAIATDEAVYMPLVSVANSDNLPSAWSRQVLSSIRVAGYQNEFYQPFFWPDKLANQVDVSFLHTIPEFGNSKTIKRIAGLTRFQSKLNDLDKGFRTQPVVVLHLGDSHISSDSYSKGVRNLLQADYGNSGRGAVIPSNAFKYAYADGVRQRSSGPWRSYMSLKTGKGVFGVSGVRVEASSRKAVMSISSKRRFDYAQVTIATGPDYGSIEIAVDDDIQTYPTYSKLPGARTITVDKAGKKLSVRPAGKGKIGVLHWSTLRNNPGVRYVNFGQSGATVNITRRWNERAVSNDLKTLNPDLIVYGFGTNEGYDDNLDIPAYRAYVSKLIKQFVSHAPNADILIIGAADGLRKRRGIACGSGWFIPKKLAALRVAMRELADQIGTGYWDWATSMGGPCSINKWATKGLAAKDRVHLTRKGYDVSAKAIYNDLFKLSDKQVLMVSNQ